MPPTRETQTLYFWALVFLSIIAKLLLVADLATEMTYAPYDDSLYVTRAYNLRHFGDFGAYDGRTFAKLPLISIAVALARSLELPWLLTTHVLYIAAGLYLLVTLSRLTTGRWISLLAFVVYLYNPITLGVEWLRVIREPVGVALFVMLVAAMINIYGKLAMSRMPWTDGMIFVGIFTLNLFLREDDRLLWILWMAGLAAVFLLPGLSRRTAIRAVLAGAVATGMSYFALDFCLRGFVQAHYGAAILHEMNEGEFPRMLAAIRSIKSAKDNRMVMLTQDRLQQAALLSPSFRHTFDHLPKPGRETDSCRLHGVCGEISNGWMPFYVRDAAYAAGMTPTLPDAQRYFGSIRLDIETACRDGRVACVDSGTGLLPPFELKWTRAVLSEAWRIAKMMIWPDVNAATHAGVGYQVPEKIRMMYADLTPSPWLPIAMRPSNMGEGFVYIRDFLVRAYGIFSMPIILGATLLALFFFLYPEIIPSDRAFLAAVGVFGIFTFLKVLLLGYVATHMGGFTSRLMFSTNVVALTLAIPLLANVLMRKFGRTRN